MKEKASKLFIILFIFCIPLLWSESEAATAGQQFYSAEVFCNNFLKDEKRLQYRDHWIVCIDKFESAYKSAPSGNLAPASLYMAGKLYMDLYARSGKTSDKREALDHFNRIVKRFPGSDYRKKAEIYLQKYPVEKNKPVQTADRRKGNIPHVKAKTEKRIDSETEDNETAPKNIPHKKRKKIFAVSKADYKQAIKEEVSDEIAELIKERKTALKPEKSRPEKSRKEEKARPSRKAKFYSAEPTVVSGLRFWSNPNYTRIVVDGDRDTEFQHELLDSFKNKPQRLYIDFDNSRLGKSVQKAIPIDDDLLLGARAAQHTLDSVRVVIDIKSFQSYKIFSLKNPFRTIIDVWGQDASIAAAKPRQIPVPQPPLPKTRENESPNYAALDKNTKVTPHDLARQLALGVRRIVIDPGHGGHDVGAPGAIKGVYEKDIVLQIGRRLAKKIRHQLGCEVIMTRSTDRYLTLEERTAIANTQNADLFVSIHCNAAQNRRAYGIETYFLNLATDDDAILVAARENATSRKNISDLQAILNDLMKNAKINESSKLAGQVQTAMYGGLKTKYSNIKNKGVKQAPFYVLLGAQMPSILVETSFISNKRECKRLMTAEYQEHLCNAIVKGIIRYVTENTPTAFLKSGPKSSSSS